MDGLSAQLINALTDVQWHRMGELFAIVNEGTPTTADTDELSALMLTLKANREAILAARAPFSSAELWGPLWFQDYAAYEAATP